MTTAAWDNAKRTARAFRSALSPRRLVTLSLAAFCCAAAAAQPPAGAGRENRSGAYIAAALPQRDFRLAAGERALWLAVVTASGSRLFHRTADSPFDLGRATTGHVAELALLDGDALVFFADDAPYRYTADARDPSPENRLPLDGPPLDAVGDGGAVYAIVPSNVAARLPAAPVERGAGASQPFDPGDAALSVVVYDGRSWSALTALPAAAQPPSDTRLRPRLCLAQGELLLFMPADLPGQVLYFHLDRQTRRWTPHGNVGSPGMTAFWVVNCANKVTFVATSAGPTDDETVAALRLLGDVGAAGATMWRLAELELSPLPAGATAARHLDAAGFNQHLVLLTLDTHGTPYLRFGRIGGPPVEPTQAVGEVVAAPRRALHSHWLVQVITIVLLALLLGGLFIFRRGSLVRPIDLPPRCALPLNVQRLAAWLIDFVPFAFAAAVMLDVRWREGLQELLAWGISPDPERGLPDQAVVLWWGCSVLGHTLYALVMESITRRTAGKALLRVYLISENGDRPGIGQIVARNLMRLIELTPQFWVFMLLVLLSRNRQRLGDIFARTLAVRMTPAEPPHRHGAPGTPPPDDNPDDSGDGAARRSANGSPDTRTRRAAPAPARRETRTMRSRALTHTIPLVPAVLAAAAAAAPAQETRPAESVTTTIPYVDKAFGFEMQVPAGWNYDRAGFFGPGGSLGLLRGVAPDGRATLQILVFREAEPRPFPEWVEYFSQQLAGISGTRSVRVKGTQCDERPAAYLVVDAQLGIDLTQTLYYCVQFDPGTIWVFSCATALGRAAGAAPQPPPSDSRDVEPPAAFTALTGTLRIFYDPELTRQIDAALERGRQYLLCYQLQQDIRRLRVDDTLRHYEIRLGDKPIGFLTRQFSRENEPLPRAGERARLREGLRVRERSYRFADDGSALYRRIDLFSSRDGQTDLYEIWQVELGPPAGSGGPAPDQPSVPQIQVCRDQCVREGDTLFSTYTTGQEPTLPPPRQPLKLDDSYLGLAWARLLPALLGTDPQPLYAFTVYDTETRTLISQAIRVLGPRPLPGQPERQVFAYELREGLAENPSLMYTDEYGNMLRLEAGPLLLTLSSPEQIERQFGARRAAVDARLGARR